ncbi:hypothetical protein KRR40_28130 [Niabella defluvii]|nr:hypothetical protein KRR40_28130 [Niabella sp. I65]
MKYAHEHQEIIGVDKAITDLNTAWAAASEDMYKQNTPGGEASNGNEQARQDPSVNGNEDVTDVPFEEVK